MKQFSEHIRDDNQSDDWMLYKMVGFVPKVSLMVFLKWTCMPLFMAGPIFYKWTSKAYHVFIQKTFPSILCNFNNLVVVATLQLPQIFTAR
jgi:hypothetical protein